MARASRRLTQIGFGVWCCNVVPAAIGTGYLTGRASEQTTTEQLNDEGGPSVHTAGRRGVRA